MAKVRHLKRILRGRTDVEVTLVSRKNVLELTPLLCSGRLELRHRAQPIRAAPQQARETTVESVDLERQLIRAVGAEGSAYGMPTTIWWSRLARRRTTVVERLGRSRRWRMP